MVRITGFGMHPTLKHGSMVDMKSVPHTAIEPGDLIVFHNGREVLCRRVLSRSRRVFYVKGDGRLTMDPPVVSSQIMGRVTRIVDPALRIRSLETARDVRWARRLARFAYFCSAWYIVRRSVRSWPSRGLQWFE